MPPDAWCDCDRAQTKPDLQGSRKVPGSVSICLMPMTCPDCGQNLDHVPTGNSCARCGGNRRSATVYANAALAGAAVMNVGVKIGYSLAPGWTDQWRSSQRHLGRLREQYQGSGIQGNVDIEETIHALYVALNHLSDWLYQDGALPLNKSAVEAYVTAHPTSLGVCRAYANTRKHMKRDSPTALIAQITSVESGPKGQTATIGYYPQSDSSQLIEVDALALAEQCERDWRGFLANHGIAIPP